MFARYRLTAFVWPALVAACELGSSKTGPLRTHPAASADIVGGAAGATREGQAHAGSSGSAAGEGGHTSGGGAGGDAAGGAGAGASGAGDGGSGGAGDAGGGAGGGGGAGASSGSTAAGGAAGATICTLPVPDDHDAVLCGVGVCTVGATCYAPLNEPPYVAQSCTCMADGWSCDTKLMPQTMYARADDCAEGGSPSTWLTGVRPWSLWLTDSHLYVSHDQWLLRAELPCGEPELVGRFSDAPSIVGSVPEGLVLSVEMPSLGPKLSPHPVWLFRPKARVVDRRDEQVVGTVSVHAGEIHTTSADRQHISFTWGAPSVVRGPLAPASSWLFGAGDGFTVQAQVFLSYQPVLHISSSFYSDDGSHQELLKSAYATRPRGLSRDGHMFINEQKQIVELLPNGVRAPTGVEGYPTWIDECQILTLVGMVDGPAPSGHLAAVPRAGGASKWLADLPVYGLEFLVAGPRHVAWWQQGVGVRFRTR